MKQLKETHPANRPLPPIPAQPYMVSPPRYTSTPVMHSTSPYDPLPPPLPPNNNSRYQSRINVARQLVLLPEDDLPPPPGHYGMTMEEDMRNGYDNNGGNTYHNTVGNSPMRAQSSLSVAGRVPRRQQQLGGGKCVLLISISVLIFLSVFVISMFLMSLIF